MGRPHKGERTAINVRAPLHLAELIYEAAVDQGFKTVNDYLLTLVAAEHSYPVRVARRDQAGQDALLASDTERELPRPRQATNTVMLGVRVPTPLAELVTEAAEEQDFDRPGHYLLSLYAKCHFFSVQVEKKNNRDQEVLPLNRAS